MKSYNALLLVLAALLVQPTPRCDAQTNVVGVIVDEQGKPVAGVRCFISGWPDGAGGHNYYSGFPTYVFSDDQGRFSLPIPRADPLVDIQCDEDGGQFVATNGVATRVPPYRHAPAFVYNVRPADGPVRVVMTEGKVLRCRIVETNGDKLQPIYQAQVELEMSQAGSWYQLQKRTDEKGEVDFKISRPSSERPWQIYFAGKRLPVDFDQVTPDTVMVIRVNVDAALSIEPTGQAGSSHATSNAL